MCGGVVLLFLVSSSLTRDIKVARGPYTPTWEGLQAWECPEWFKDAKFGIWAHWGPQCEAESGDWYARHMYYEYHWQNHNHVKKYGNPNDFGLMDLCNEWKGENWDPEELVALYKSVGARYFFTLGQHHDNFDLWNSKYQEWNSAKIGPKRDIVKEWADACKKWDLPLGVSMHGSHTWTWLEKSQDYEGNLTKEDGYKPNADGSENGGRASILRNYMPSVILIARGGSRMVVSMLNGLGLMALHCLLRSISRSFRIECWSVSINMNQLFYTLMIQSFHSMDVMIKWV